MTLDLEAPQVTNLPGEEEGSAIVVDEHVEGSDPRGPYLSGNETRRIQDIVDTYCPRITAPRIDDDQRFQEDELLSAFCHPEKRSQSDLCKAVFESFRVSWDKMIIEILKQSVIAEKDYDTYLNHARYAEFIDASQLISREVELFLMKWTESLYILSFKVICRRYIYSTNKTFIDRQKTAKTNGTACHHPDQEWMRGKAQEWRDSFCPKNIIQWTLDIQKFLKEYGLQNLGQFYRKGAQTTRFSPMSNSNQAKLRYLKLGDLCQNISL